MEGKVYELVTRMYSDINAGFDNIENKMTSIQNDIKGIGNQVAKMENDLKPKVETALETYTLICEKLKLL